MTHLGIWAHTQKVLANFKEGIFTWRMPEKNVRKRHQLKSFPEAHRVSQNTPEPVGMLETRRRFYYVVIQETNAPDLK